MKRIATILTLCVSAASPAFAQMDNVVEVENTYTPVVKDANKINVLPEVEPTSVTHYQVQYADQAQPAKTYVFDPSEVVQSDVAQNGEPRGFATIGGGVRGNLNLRGAYDFRLGSNDDINVDFSLRGHKGRVEHAFYDVEDWSSRFYTTRASAVYRHHFKEQGTFVLRGNLESQVFNYMAERVGDHMLTTDKQHNWMSEVSAALTPFRFGRLHIGGDVGYNSFLQKYIHYQPFSGDRTRELQVFAHLTTRFDLDDSHAVGIDIQENFTNYNFDTFDDYNSFTLLPHYDYKSDKWLLRAGLKIHNNSGFQNRLRLAADVDLRYHASSRIDLFATATGGEVRNEFRLFNQMTPYWSYNYQHQLAHQFDRLRTTFGVDWKWAEGLFARFYAGYDQSKNRAELYGASDLTTADGSLFHMNADISYQQQNLWGFDAHVRFNGWATDADEHIADDLIAWRPIIDTHFAAHYNILPRLQVGADYVFQTFSQDGMLYKRPTTHNLGANVSYTMPTPAVHNGSLLSFYLRGDNLLNRDFDAYNGYRTQGITFLLGAAITF